MAQIDVSRWLWSTEIQVHLNHSVVMLIMCYVCYALYSIYVNIGGIIRPTIWNLVQLLERYLDFVLFVFQLFVCGPGLC